MKNEITRVPSSSWAMALVGALVLTVLPALLLGTTVSALSKSGDGVAFVDPANAMAGFGFAGLGLALVFWMACNRFRFKPSTGSSKSAPGLAISLIAALVALSVFAAETMTNVYAARNGYQRCKSRDRFQAGNVPKNDITLHAYVRLDAAVALCSGRPVVIQ